MTSYFATCAKGIEELLAGELRSLDGARDVVPGTGGVAFAGTDETLLSANLWLRTAQRVLVPLAEFACASAEELYEGAHALDWTSWLTPEMTLAVDANVRDSVLTHSRWVAQKTKDAIVDSIRERRGARPNVNPRDPSVQVNLRLFRNRATVSLDASGTSLHERGYRVAGGAAPLKETLAAAIVLASGWRAPAPLLHPMCGTGTIAIEAALWAGDVAPGLLRAERRQLGFLRWRSFQPALWQKLVRTATVRRAAGARALAQPLAWASDRDPRAVAAARSNARAAGVVPAIRLERRDLAAVRPPPGAAPGVVIVNPPYGERLGEAARLAPLYAALGDLLKQHFRGWTAEVLTGAPELAKSIALRTSRRLPLWNGPIECRLLRYQLY